MVEALSLMNWGIRYIKVGEITVSSTVSSTTIACSNDIHCYCYYNNYFILYIMDSTNYCI